MHNIVQYSVILLLFECLVNAIAVVHADWEPYWCHCSDYLLWLMSGLI